ncbi:transmembrane protein 70 homolog, mitochondrial [Leptopilina boulardi]|uniref:transmembrane protein 70 homolog, mitochondrial n=1 Tax=Leptopilina boulardi TaxID=63433 RepID=UPI0021F64C40|nr:transmembrane protein 70 homolog, mitochondrial [Leptopilina boulardi]
MALLLKSFISNYGKRCFLEISHSKYTCLVNTKIFDNKIKITTCVKSRNFSTNETKQNSSSSSSLQIYTGILTRQIRNIKIFSLFTSCLGIMAQPIIYQKMAQSNGTATLIGVSVFFCFFAIATPLLLHIITKKYITHIKYLPEQDKYIASTYTIFLKEKQIDFKPKDVLVPDVPGMFTSCFIKKTPLFLTPESFDDLYHYKRIMGYDKPIDLKLDNPLNNDKVAEPSK